MNYLYHRVSKDFKGDILYPLNELKDAYPDIYKSEVEKYVGRESVMEQRIPGLGCLWNDALHFTTVEPKHFKEAFLSLGKEYIWRCFQIDPALFTKDNTVIYLYQHKNQEDKFTPENFISYDPALLDEYQSIPEETIRYYKECLEKNEDPMVYHRIPHILHHGNIRITNLPIVEA